MTKMASLVYAAIRRLGSGFQHLDERTQCHLHLRRVKVALGSHESSLPDRSAWSHQPEPRTELRRTSRCPTPAKTETPLRSEESLFNRRL
jgi:hypothetical protein